MTYTGSKADVLGYGTALSIGPLASATGSAVYTLIGEIENLKLPNSKRAIVMVTNFQSPGGSVEKRGVAIDFGQVTFTTNYVPNDAGQLALNAGNVTGNGNPFLFQLALSIDTPDGETVAGPVASFQAIIVEAGGINISLTEVAKSDWVLDITGPVTWAVGS